MRRPSVEWMTHAPGSRADDIDRELRTMQDDPVMDTYKPSFLGEGGEQMVFAIPNHPHFVVKVQHEHLASVIRRHIADGALQEPTPVERKAEEELLAKNRQAHRMMREYFDGAVLREFQYILPIPLTTDVLRVMAGDHLPALPDGITHIPTFVRVQEKIPEAAERNGIDFAFRYIERSGSITDDEYEKLNGIFAGTTSPEEYLATALNNPELVTLLGADENLRKVVRGFVETAIRFTEETGEMLDLAGAGNVLAYKENDTWRIILPDAMYPHRDAWTDVRDATDLFSRGEELDQFLANRLMNGLNYARLINALAEISGSSRRLTVSRQPLTGKFVTLRHAIRDADRQS